MAKSPWLQEVEDDAVRIQTKRFNDYFEEQELKRSKEEGFSARMKAAREAKRAKVETDEVEPKAPKAKPKAKEEGAK